MNKLDPIILGINHMFLYPVSMTDANIHTVTLRKLSENPQIEALDCWVWAGHKKEELQILRECGKVINYNVGDRFQEEPAFPATADAAKRAYSMEILRRESDFALECGAKKIIFGSGKDVPEDRDSAKERFCDFVAEWSSYLPEDVCLCLEPTDWDLDKRFLMGPLEDAVSCVHKLRQYGCNIGILLDMGHIPLMHETLETAVRKTVPVLRHIHLGNCILKNKDNVLYGDKHPCWGATDGEYDENDGERFLQVLKDAGYLSGGSAQTISFEMRPLTGMDAEQTLAYLNHWFHKII